MGQARSAAHASPESLVFVWEVRRNLLGLPSCACHGEPGLCAHRLCQRFNPRMLDMVCDLGAQRSLLETMLLRLAERGGGKQVSELTACVCVLVGLHTRRNAGFGPLDRRRKM